MPIKAVIFDYIGTLVNCRGYSMADSEDNLHCALTAEGFEIEKGKFLDAYNVSHQKYRKVRYEQFREVTNAVWVSEALYALGYKVAPDDARVKAALNVFFQDFIDTLELREGAKKLLKQTAGQYRVRLNQQLHPRTRHSQKPKKSRHTPLLQRHRSIRGCWMEKACFADF